jgi:MutS domain I
MLTGRYWRKYQHKILILATWWSGILKGLGLTVGNGLPKMFEEYGRVRGQHTAILAWQMGDWFEFYLDDAKIVAEVCTIAITTRWRMANGEALPMCGVPADTRFSVGFERTVISLTPTDYFFGQIVEAGYPLAVAVYANGRDGRDGWKVVATFDPADFTPTVGPARAVLVAGAA